MIRLLKVNPSGYFSYGIHNNIDIDNLGTVLVDGHNGAGKTSLFNSICHILFGKNPTGATADDITNSRLGRRFGFLLFTDAAGITWRIIETRKWRKSDKYPDDSINEPSAIVRLQGGYTGSDVFLERWNGTEWADERGTNDIGKMKLTTDATRDKICSILNCSYEQFVDSCYLIQQEGLRLISGKHKERYAIIARLADTDKWETRKNSVYADRIRLEQEVENDIARLSGMRSVGMSDIQTLLADKAGRLVNLDKLSASLTSVRLRQSELTALKANLTTEVNNSWEVRNTLISEVREADATRSVIEALRYQLFADYTKAANLIKDDRSIIPAELTNLEANEPLLTFKISMLNADLGNLLSGESKCPKCKSYVTIAHIEKHRTLIKLEIAEIESELANIRERMKVLNSEVEGIREARLAGLMARYEIMNTATKELQNTHTLDLAKITGKAEAALFKWREGTNNIAQIEAEESSILSTIMQNTMMIEVGKSDIAHIESQIDNIRKTEEAAGELEIQINVKKKKIKNLLTIERLFGDRGMQQFVLENTVSQLNSIISAKLTTVSKTIRMWVSSFKEKADGSLGVEMQVYVKDGTKDQIPFSLFSGGERQIMNMVLMDSYSELAARLGTGFNILFLDEIFGPLDGTNAAEVFKYIEGMSAKSRSSIFLTAHDTNIKYSVDFDKIMTATKKDEITTMTVGEGR